MQNNFNHKLGKKIAKIIDFFYPPFQRFFPQQLFRYGVCGAANTIFGWVLYYSFYHYLFEEQNFTILFLTFSPHIAALFTQFPITFFTGFWLSKYVSFSKSKMHGGTQAFRYLLIVIACILINYVGLKFFVEVCGFFPTPSQMLNTLITTIFSFFAQKYFSFK